VTAPPSIGITIQQAKAGASPTKLNGGAVDGYAVSVVVRPVRRTAVAVFNPGTADPAPFADRLLDIVAP
jgi:hypothetical protein